MNLNGEDIVEASLLRLIIEEPGPFPTSEEAILLCEEDEPAEVSGPTPRHLEIPRYIEPAEWTTTPVTSTVPHLEQEAHCHPSQKGKSLWRGIDVDPNKPDWCVQAYLERDNRLPKWWKEFHPLVHSVDGHCDDAQVKILAHWQAVAYLFNMEVEILEGAEQGSVTATFFQKECYVGQYVVESLKSLFYYLLVV